MSEQSTTETAPSVSPDGGFVSSVDAQIDALLKTPNPDKSQLAAAYERRAFERYVATAPDALGNAKTIDDAFKSYGHLQAKLTTTSQENAALKAAVAAKEAAKATEAAPPAVAPQIEVPKAPEVKPAIITAAELKNLEASVFASGDITPEARESLKSRGYEEEVINAFISGAKANSAILSQRTQQIAGSKERAAAALAWAAANATPHEINAWNENLRNPAMVEITMRGIMSKYDAANAGRVQEPKSLANQASVNTPQSTTVVPYETLAAFGKDRNDPRFMRDEAFRNAVIARMNVTDVSKLPPA